MRKRKLINISRIQLKPRKFSNHFFGYYIPSKERLKIFRSMRRFQQEPILRIVHDECHLIIGKCGMSGNLLLPYDEFRDDMIVIDPEIRK